MTKPRNPVQPLSQVEPQVLTWLWPGRLAEGKLALFDGDPGRGKSLVSLDLCARVTTGPTDVPTPLQMDVRKQSKI